MTLRKNMIHMKKKLLLCFQFWRPSFTSFTLEIETENKQENSEDEVKNLERRNLNPVIVPDDVDHFSDISEAQILNIDSKIPEFVQEFHSEELFSEIDKIILKYTNVFKNLASRLIFMTIFLLTLAYHTSLE